MRSFTAAALTGLVFAIATTATTTAVRAEIKLDPTRQVIESEARAGRIDAGDPRAPSRARSPRGEPRVAPQRAPQPLEVRYEPGFLAAQPEARGDAEWKCLAQALYFEARGESVRGQFAVAEVILNRRDSVEFPDTVCGVVNQGTGRKYACQFTFTCDGAAETVTEPAAWRRAGKIAALMLQGAPRALTEGATHYHTRAVSPKWARAFARTASIGAHYFYRQPTRLSSN